MIAWEINHLYVGFMSFIVWIEHKMRYLVNLNQQQKFDNIAG